MSLVTGTPIGSVTTQEDLYIDGAPNIFYQDYTATPLWNPDGDGYYWGMSGTSTYGVKELGCITEVSLEQGVTANDVRCDTVGLKGTIQRRDYIDFIFSLQSFFPLSIYAEIGGFSAATVVTNYEKMGMGVFDNTQYWMVYAPRVYSDDAGDYLTVHLHKCQFVNPGPLQMRYGEPWIQSFTLRAFADTTKPSTQQFGTLIRFDRSVLG